MWPQSLQLKAVLEAGVVREGPMVLPPDGAPTHKGPFLRGEESDVVEPRGGQIRHRAVLPRISTEAVAPWLGPNEPPVTRPMKMGRLPGLGLLDYEAGTATAAVFVVGRPSRTCMIYGRKLSIGPKTV